MVYLSAWWTDAGVGVRVRARSKTCPGALPARTQAQRKCTACAGGVWGSKQGLRSCASGGWSGRAFQPGADACERAGGGAQGHAAASRRSGAHLEAPSELLSGLGRLARKSLPSRAKFSAQNAPAKRARSHFARRQRGGAAPPRVVRAEARAALPAPRLLQCLVLEGRGRRRLAPGPRWTAVGVLGVTRRDESTWTS